MKTEPNKMEQEFKRKLAQREIQPSPMAWDRLDAMLSVAEKKKKPKTWLFIAAGFLGLLLAGTLFLKMQNTGNGNTVAPEGNNVVTHEQPAQTSEGQKAGTEATKKIMPQQIISETAVAVQQPAPATYPEKQIKAQQAVKNGTKKTNINEAAPAQRQEAMAAAEVKQSPDTQNRVIVPAQEAEELLAGSLADNTPKKEKPSVKVDPKSLLSSVEDELNESFRTKVYQAAVKNYQAVKTSVANRNYN